MTIIIISCSKDELKLKENEYQHEINTRSSSCPDYLDVAGCDIQSGGFVQGGTLLYEGCRIPYTVSGVKCSWGIYMDPPEIDWSYINKAAASPGNNSCKEFANRLLSLYSDGREIELNETLLDIKKLASLFAQNRTLEFQSQINENFYPCDGNIVPMTYSVVTQESECTMFCAEIITGHGIIISEVLCGTGCCTRSTPFCVNGPGDIIYGVPEYDEVLPCTIDDLSIDSPYNATCPSGSTPLGICNAACSKI